MKTVIGIWITIIVTGIWLLFIQPAQAFDIRSCHLLSPGDLNPQTVVSHLPEGQVAQLKTAFTTNQSDSSDYEQSDYFQLAGKPEFSSVYDEKSLSSLGLALAINPSYQNAQRNYSVVLRQLNRIASQ